MAKDRTNIKQTDNRSCLFIVAGADNFLNKFAMYRAANNEIMTPETEIDWMELIIFKIKLGPKRESNIVMGCNRKFCITLIISRLEFTLLSTPSVKLPIPM